jgi:hypothetical protein
METSAHRLRLLVIVVKRHKCANYIKLVATGHNIGRLQESVCALQFRTSRANQDVAQIEANKFTEYTLLAD